MKLSTWFGKRCVATKGKRSYELLVFDWKKLKHRKWFMLDIFGDCEVPGDYPAWLARNKADEVIWANENEVPFALLEPAEWKFRSGMDIPPEVRELWVSDPSCDGPVHAIEIEGSAVPKRRASKVVARRSMLKFEEPALEPKPRPARAPKGGPSFDAERAVLSQITSDGPTRSAALGLLQRLGGWKSKKPLQIDPRWVTALKEVLLQAVLAKDGSAATQVATTLDVYDPEGAHMASVVTEVVGRSPASNDLHALTEVFRQLSSKGPAGVDGAMQLLTKAGKRATAIDDELIDYLAYGGSARHLGPLKAVKKLRRFKKIDVALDWVSFRAASPKKKFTWHSNPHLD